MLTGSDKCGVYSTIPLTVDLPKILLNIYICK